MKKKDAIKELREYIGIPRCMDCKWKLNTDITNNCGCHGNITQEQKEKYFKTLNRAKELQNLIFQRLEKNNERKTS